VKPAFEILKAFSHLFFPQICYACGSSLLGTDQLLCLRCLHELPYTRFEKYHHNPVERIFWGRLAIHEAASLFYFTKDSIVERLLHQLKYKGRREVGTYCGRLMGAALQKVERFKDIDGIIPLPLFRRKERERGFNQAKLLCDGLKEMINKPIMDDVILRIEATETQTHKNRIERWQNMEHRFEVEHPELLKGKHILLVDDVITTGATLESCAQELLGVENTRLSILTLAYSSSRNV